MDVADIYVNCKDPPIITLGDDLQGILGLNSTDSSIFTDILLRKKDETEEMKVNDVNKREDMPSTRELIVPERSMEISDIWSKEKLEIVDSTERIVPKKLTETEDVFFEAKEMLAKPKPMTAGEIIDFPVHPLANSDSSLQLKFLNFAVEYESLARSILLPSPAPPGDETKKYTCPICLKSFSDRKYLNRHSDVHTKRFTCPHCKKSFSRKEVQQKHIPKCRVLNPKLGKRRTKIAKEKPTYCCDECSKQFTRKENLYNHMLKHKGIRILCNDCQKTFSSWKSFLLHKKLHDSTRTVYFCDHCSAIFYFKSNLRRHLRLALVKDTIICDVCNLRVKDQEKLDYHRDQSTKRCVSCSHLFCLDRDLRKHRKVLHPEICFKCKLCDASTPIIFTARSEHHLRNHVRRAHNVSLTFMNCYEEGWYVSCE